MNRTASSPNFFIISEVREALRDEFKDTIEVVSITVKEVRKDEIRLGIKNPLVRAEVFLRQEKLLQRINNRLRKIHRKVTRMRISS